MASPFALEFGLAVVLAVVFAAGLFASGEDRRFVGRLATVGVLGLIVLSLFLSPVDTPAGAPFVQDGLALFAKRLFLLATFIGLLGGLSLPGTPFARRSAEYHLLILTSLLGMLVLASARDMLLLFVAFELMSIPLYVLSGFVKRRAEAGESALKFFLVGSVSSAIMVYGLSFVYGAAGTTHLDGVAEAWAVGDPLILLGFLTAFAGFGFKIAAFPFHMWVPDTYEAASTPFVAWLSVAPKAAGFVAIVRLYVEGMGEHVAWLVPVAAGLATITVIAGNLMALPQQNAKRLLAYSGIAHIGYMLIGLAAASAAGTAMVLFYLVAYVFANMGAFLVVEAVGRSEASETLTAFSGLAQRSPMLALSMLLFLLSLGGIPFVAGFWAKLYVFWAAAEQGLYWLVLLGAILTVVALFYYLVLAKRMYVDSPVRPDRIPLSPSLRLALALCVLGIVVMGVYPKPVVLAAFQVTSGLF